MIFPQCAENNFWIGAMADPAMKSLDQTLAEINITAVQNISSIKGTDILFMTKHTLKKIFGNGCYQKS